MSYGLITHHSLLITPKRWQFRVMSYGLITHHSLLLYDFSGEAEDLVELDAEFAGNGAEDARAARVVVVVQEDQRVRIEANVAAVLAAGGDLGADHHAFDHVALLH